MSKTPDERLAHLEQLLTYLDQMVHTLNEVVIRQQRQLDAVEQGLARLTVEMNQPRGKEESTLLDEKPPHY